jgi:hypothetical protein
VFSKRSLAEVDSQELGLMMILAIALIVLFIAYVLDCLVCIPSMMEHKRGTIIVSSGLSRYPREGFIAHNTANSKLTEIYTTRNTTCYIPKFIIYSLSITAL